MRSGFQTSLIYFQSANRPKNLIRDSSFRSECQTHLVDRHVLVVLLQVLPVLGDLNGLTIENTNRDVLAVKLNRTVSRRNPSFERRFSVIAERYPHVSSFERLDGDPVLFT